jgi:hypothetical protein
MRTSDLTVEDVKFTVEGGGRTRAFREILRKLDPLAGRTLVDLGCGPCLFAKVARDEGFLVTAVDSRTERIPLPEELDDIFFVQSDVRYFDVRDYDVVAILGLLYHLDLDDQMRLLKKANGSTVIVDTQFHDPARIRANPEPWELNIVERNGYRGVVFPEGDNTQASWKNRESFWPTEDSLLRMYADAGYRSVTKIEPSYVTKYGARRFYVLNSLA